MLPAFIKSGRGVDLLITVAGAAVFISFVCAVAGAGPLDAFYQLIKGSLGSALKLSHVIKAWIPLTLCACGLLFTFRIGLWNIGVEGQMMMGAVFATAALRLGVDSSNGAFWIFLSMAAAMAGGGIWAFLAGILKTKGGVNEIFAGLGLNFVAQGVVLWLIFGPWKRAGVASMSGTEIFPDPLWLPMLTKIRIPIVGLILVAAALAVTVFILNHAKLGLKFKAIGCNPVASILFGLSPGRQMLAAMLLAGGMAGLAGNVQVAGIYHRLIPAISSNYGYLALLVVMLANYKARYVPVVAFFFACLNVGSIQLPMVLRLDSSLSGVIQGATVLWRFCFCRDGGPGATLKPFPPFSGGNDLNV